MSLGLSFYICVMGTALVQEAELRNTYPPKTCRIPGWVCVMGRQL